MTPAEQQSFLEEVLASIDNKELILPTLPDAALKLRKLIDDPNVSASQVVLAISSDPVISAQVIKTANSAAFYGKPPVGDVTDAVSRLGYRLLHNTVLAITVGKMFHSNNSVINKRLKSVWEHSREVASISYVIALHQKHLQPDHAMMAGLIHDIGALPVCLFAEQKGMELDAETLDSLILKCHEQVGLRLLKNWNFPQDLIDVAAEHENFHRDEGSATKANYTDVVIVANLQERVTAKVTAWNNIAAVKKLGLTPEDCQNFLERFAEQISVMQGMLGIAKSTTTTLAADARLLTIQSTTPSGLPNQSSQPTKRGLSSILNSLLGK